MLTTHGIPIAIAEAEGCQSSDEWNARRHINQKTTQNIRGTFK